MKSLRSKEASPIEKSAASIRQVYRRCFKGKWLGFFALVSMLPNMVVFAETVPDPSNMDAAKYSGATLEEIIVTATKRTANIESVPISITALTGEHLKESGADRIETVVSSVPGLSYNSNGANSAVYTIRGISSSSAVSNTQSGVALYVDDIPLLDPFSPGVTTDLRLFDIDRVEVLRGPQGTLFGSGALSGAIRMITNTPDSTRFSISTEEGISHTEGGGSGYAVNGMVNIPVVEDVLAVRIVGYDRHDGGWVTNTQRGRSNVNSGESVGGRVAVKWTPAPDWSIKGSILTQHDRPDDSAFSTFSSNAYSYNSSVPDFTRQDAWIYNLTVEHTMPWAVVTSTTTNSYKSEYRQIDLTALTERISGLSGPSQLVDQGPAKTFVQELRLASAGEGPLQWIGGLYYQHFERPLTESLVTASDASALAPPGFGNHVLEYDSYPLKVSEEAIFGEVSYQFLRHWSATAGVRVFHDTVDTKQIGNGLFDGGPIALSQSGSEHAATPKFTLSYTPIESLLLYLQAAEGYRVGQTNLSPPADPVSGQVIPQSYGSDKLWNYEAGIKSSAFDRRLSVDADVYYIDWNRIQLQTNSVPSGLTYTTNAGTATVKGAEIAVTSKPWSALDISTSFSYLDARLTQVTPGVNALVGDRLPGSAPFTAYIAAKYTLPTVGDAKPYVRIEYGHTGSKYSDLNNPTALQYGNVNELGIRLGALWTHWEIVGSIDNIANSDRVTSAFFLIGEPVAIRQRPRTIGVTLRGRM